MSNSTKNGSAIKSAWRKHLARGGEFSLRTFARCARKGDYGTLLQAKAEAWLDAKAGL